jgi:hypothetical protein
VATTWLAFLVFLLPRKDMEARLGAVTGLFLALAAIQFVITGGRRPWTLGLCGVRG